MKPLDNFTTLYERLPAEKKRYVDRYSEIVERKKGEIIFEQGVQADAVYTIEHGVVEVIVRADADSSPRSVAYLSSGNIFGELGVVTGRPRISTIRVCENVRLRRFSLENFFKLLETLPPFGIFLASNLADRLYRFTSEHYYTSYTVDFSGNLENFDLLTVFQTLQSSGRTGELILTNSSNDLIGSFLFVRGDVEYARFLHLNGVEAVWQMFITEKLDGSFAFQASDHPEPDTNAGENITLRGMDLLMQAASKRDTYQGLPPETKAPTRELTRLAEEFSWDDPETEAPAHIIWQHIQKRPRTLDTLWRLTNLSQATIFDVAIRMHEKQLANFSA